MKHEHARFLEKVQHTTAGCWEWTGATYRYGYGHFRRRIGDRWVMYKTHRYSYEYHKGPIPPNKMVLHTCDNPSCVNPEHLYVGTAQDNANDMKQRGRKSFGRNPNHKLLSYDIAQELRYIKTEHPSYTLDDFVSLTGISKPQLSRILNNKIWKSPEEL